MGGSPVVRRLFFLFRMIGCFIAVSNLVTEVTYLIKHQFSSVEFFACYTATCALKLLAPFFLALVSLRHNVLKGQHPNLLAQMDTDKRRQMKRSFIQEGVILYLGIPLSYYTGVYRIMSVKAFAKEVGLGFVYDLFFTLVLIFL